MEASPFYDAVITKLQGLLQQRRKATEVYSSNQATNSKQMILPGSDKLLTLHWPKKIEVRPTEFSSLCVYLCPISPLLIKILVTCINGLILT